MKLQRFSLVILGLILIGWNTAGYTIKSNWQNELQSSSQQTEQNTPESEAEDEYWLVIGEAVVPLASFQLVHDLIIEFELPLLVTDQELASFFNLIPINHYFETLFQLIISINAP